MALAGVVGRHLGETACLRDASALAAMINGDVGQRVRPVFAAIWGGLWAVATLVVLGALVATPVAEGAVRAKTDRP